MRKSTKKVLVLALGALILAPQSMSAQGSKRTLKSENYESATASDWTCPNGNAVLKTGDAVYGNYAQCYPSGNGNRSCYKSVTYDYTAGTGFTTADMGTSGYNIEFDMVQVSGNVANRSVSQFVVPTSGPNLATNTTYAGTDYIFALSQPQRTASSTSTTWYINDLTNATGQTVNLDGSKWYHVKLVVTAESVGYTITDNATSEQVAQGALAVSSLPTITGFWNLLGRGSGKINFDNLDIYDYTATATASAPTFTLKAVNGESRTYTVTNPNAGGTLYYTTVPADEAPATGDAAYTAVTDAAKDVIFTQSGTYYAYAALEDNVTVSTVVSAEVTTGAITLPTPVYVISNLKAGYEKSYKVTASNDVLLAPTVSLQYVFTPESGPVQAPVSLDNGGTIASTEAGEYVITASADGYTSSSVTITNDKAYRQTRTIDFTAFTADDFTEIWTEATGAPRDKWTTGDAAIPADATYYKLNDPAAESAATAVEGITISNYTQRQPHVYIGFGLLTPYEPLSGSGNYMNFTVNDATEGQYAVYEGWNNYGSGTFTTVQEATAPFGLYRYDTMLKTIKLYSEDLGSVDATITPAGYATFSSSHALDFSGVTGLKAYVASSVTAEGAVVMTRVEGAVPANTGLLLKGASAIIPVVATATAPAANFLVATVTETPVAASADGAYNYMLANGDNGIGFYKVETATTSAAGKAYLQTATALGETSGTKTVKMIFSDGTATGISEINSAAAAGDGVYYNLNGMRVQNPTKGLYILNGKKMMK